MSAYTAAERNWETRLPGEEDNLTAPLLRGIFTSIDECLTELGHPFTTEQRQILRDALAMNVGTA